VALTASQEARENSTLFRPGNTTAITETAITEHAPTDDQLIFRPNETLTMGSSISDTIDRKVTGRPLDQFLKLQSIRSLCSSSSLWNCVNIGRYVDKDHVRDVQMAMLKV
jgi:hypothetical protein